MNVIRKVGMILLNVPNYDYCNLHYICKPPVRQSQDLKWMSGVIEDY